MIQLILTFIVGAFLAVAGLAIIILIVGVLLDTEELERMAEMRERR